MYKYSKGLGVFNKKGSTGRKIPPSVVLQGLRKQAMKAKNPEEVNIDWLNCYINYIYHTNLNVVAFFL